MSDFSLVPVDHQPEFSDVSFIPVDHNPFVPDDIVQRAGARPEGPTPTAPATDADLPDVGAPIIGDGGQFSAGTVIGNKAAGIASKIVHGAIKQLATLPQRALEASATDVMHLGESDYTPQSIGPALEAGMMTMGAGPIVGVPIKTGEALLGAGPVRRPRPLDPETLAAIKAGRVAKEITLSRSTHGEAAAHIADAIAAGHPSILTIHRPGIPANRWLATGRLDKVPGKHLDEYPPAMFREGGARASVRPIDPSYNTSAGGFIGRLCYGLPDGARIKIIIGD